MRKALALSWALALATPVTLHAAGETPYDFLSLDSNARAVALGGAFTALAVDDSAVFYNPAGLGKLRSHSATFMHNEYLQGVHQQTISAAFLPGFGLGLNYLDSGSVPRTTISNPSGAGLSGASLNDLAVNLAYGHEINDRLSLGGAAKHLRESADGRVSGTFAFDAGVLYQPWGTEHTAVAFVAQNVGPSVKRDAGREALPFTWRAGFRHSPAWRERAVTFAADAVQVRGEDTDLSFGMSVRTLEEFVLRAGYSTRPADGLGVTAGVGWTNRRFSVDYAVSPFDSLGIAHRLSLSFAWGEDSQSKVTRTQGMRNALVSAERRY